eukprot:7033205-Prorocentrum_lima.AAC.1
MATVPAATTANLPRDLPFNWPGMKRTASVAELPPQTIPHDVPNLELKWMLPSGNVQRVDLHLPDC